jgi:fluoride ion exporter CrcB/FEX
LACESVACRHQGRAESFLLNVALTNLLCLFAVLLGIRLHN